jgi:hypothetical protein
MSGDDFHIGPRRAFVSYEMIQIWLASPRDDQRQFVLKIPVGAGRAAVVKTLLGRAVEDGKQLEEPPRLAEFLFTMLASSSHAEAAIGDLNERYADDCRERVERGQTACIGRERSGRWGRYF